jgi:hypothetical protein
MAGGVAPASAQSTEPLVLTLTPSTNVLPGMPLTVTLTGPDQPYYQPLVVCAASVAVGDLVPTGPCQVAGETLPPPDPTGVQAVASFTGFDGTEVQCDAAPGACIVGVATPSVGELLASAPYTFGGPRTVTLSQSTGLLDDEVVEVTASSLLPDTEYRLSPCGPWPGASGSTVCEQGTGVLATSSPTGTLTASAPVAQNFAFGLSQYVVCSEGCTIGIRQAATGFHEGEAAYDLADAVLTATPATGLTDGQQVTLEGTDLMAAYSGPPLWIFPVTGQWGVGQCDAGIVDQTTVLGVFQHCGAVPTGPVQVPGSTLSTPVTVAAELTTFLGDTVDCTATADTCVLALARIELDGSVTVHTTPIALA